MILKYGYRLHFDVKLLSFVFLLFFMKCVCMLDKDVRELKPENVTMKLFVRALLELARRHREELHEILNSNTAKKEIIIKKYGMMMKLGRNMDELIELLKHRVKYEINGNEITVTFSNEGMKPIMLGYTIAIRGKYDYEARYTVTEIKREGDKIIIRGVAQ